MSKLTKRLMFRSMGRKDLPAVLRIETEAFEHPWTEDDFFEVLPVSVSVVVELDGAVVGFMIYDLHHDYIEIINFAVHHAYRRRGIGTEMVHKLMKRLHYDKRTQLEADVWDHNDRAHFFFRACKLRATGVVVNAFDAPVRDAYHFVYSINGVALLEHEAVDANA